MATVSGKRSILLTVGHENWIEQHSKQDSNNYLIPQFSKKRRLYFIRRQRYIETVMRDTSNVGMQSCTKSCYSIEYSIHVH